MGMALTAAVSTPVTTSPVATDASVSELLQAASGLLQAAYARVSGDHPGLSEEDLMGDIVVAQQVQNTAWAIQSHRLVAAAAIEHRDDPNPVQGAYPMLIHRVIRHDPRSYVDEWFPVEAGTRLGWSDRQTDTRLGEALDTLQWCPRLLDRVGAGTLDPGKACAVAQVTTDAPEHVAKQIEDKVLAGDPEGTTATKLRAKARRLRVRLDPVGADAAAQARRRSAVGVWVSPHHEPGLSQLTAVLPTLDAAKLMASVDELARDLHQVTTTDKTLPECRIDALTDLVLNGVGIDTHLTFLVPVTTPTPEPATPTAQNLDRGDRAEQDFSSPDFDDLGWSSDESWHFAHYDRLDQELRALITEEQQAVPIGAPGGVGDVLLPRVGVIPAAVIEQMAQLLGVTLSRALTDATTGAVIETADRSYRPGARLARFIQTRDQHCRFPGCTRPAKLSDIDHVIRYPDGDTQAGNLQCLCRHHHRAKHEGRWHVTMTGDGVCTWTSPAGHTYTTHPGD